jgi:beta-1,4-mannosyl-glycoprotein beta-1,4-N-acetylglucosaminyltransferase
MNIQSLRAAGHQVVDVFPFFNELELLELRLRILSPYVDTFVLVECPQTFSGGRKPLYFWNNQSRFANWSHKIFHHVVPDPVESMTDIQKRLTSLDLSETDRWILTHTVKSKLATGDFHWKQEFFQKESIRKAIPNCKPRDVIFFGDLDEIWNPMMEFEWDEKTLFRLTQSVHPYWLNNKSDEVWTSAVFTAYQNLHGRLLNELRMTSAGMAVKNVPNAGWHFTFQGGESRVRLKLESFGHQEFNTKRVKRKIAGRLEKRKDVLGRKFSFQKSEDGLPAEVLALKPELPEWFL